MIIFESMGLKLVSANKAKISNIANLVFSVRVDKEKRKTLVFNFSEELLKELCWAEVERVNVFSDGKQMVGISNCVDLNTVSYQLIKNTSQSLRREVKITWKDHIIKEPKKLQKFNLEYQIIKQNGVSGIQFTLPNNIFDGE